MDHNEACEVSCTSNDDCEPGSRCALVDPSDPNAPIVLRCAPRLGAFELGDACQRDDVCGSGLCHEGFCTEPCGTCANGMACEPSTIHRYGIDTNLSVCRWRLAAPALELGPIDTPLPDGASVEFDVPPNLASFVVVLESDEGLRVTAESLQAPDGTLLIDPADRASSLNPAVDYIGIVSVLVPASDRVEGRPQPGRWRIRPNTYDPTLFGELQPLPGRIDRISVLFEPETEVGGQLDLVLGLSPGLGIDVKTASTSTFVMRLLERIDTHYAPAEVRTADVRFVLLDATHDTVEDGVETRGMCATLSEPGPRGVSVNVFVVEDLSYTDGHSGGIPGPPGIHRSNGSCIVVESLGNGAHTGTLVAHEIGHFLGLHHTTGVDGRPDPISDTPICAEGTEVSECPDYDNLLFPIFPLQSDLQLTPGQIDVLRRNPLLHERPR